MQKSITNVFFEFSLFCFSCSWLLFGFSLGFCKGRIPPNDSQTPLEAPKILPLSIFSVLTPVFPYCSCRVDRVSGWSWWIILCILVLTKTRMTLFFFVLFQVFFCFFSYVATPYSTNRLFSKFFREVSGVRFGGVRDYLESIWGSFERVSRGKTIQRVKENIATTIFFAILDSFKHFIHKGGCTSNPRQTWGWAWRGDYQQS